MAEEKKGFFQRLADQFARDYFLDRARLLEEIAERI